MAQQLVLRGDDIAIQVVFCLDIKKYIAHTGWGPQDS